MTTELSELEARLKDLDPHMRRNLKLFNEAKMYRAIASQHPKFTKFLNNPEHKETFRQALVAKRKNRVVAMHYVADTILQNLCYQNLGTVKATGNAWEVNTKAEQGALFSSDYFLPSQMLNTLESFEKKYVKDDYAISIIRGLKRDFAKIIPRPHVAAQLHNDPSLLDESKLYVRPDVWKKGINLGIEAMMRIPKYGVWLNVYSSSILSEKFDLAQMQLREKTKYGLVNRLAVEATRTILMESAYETLSHYNSEEIENILSKEKLSLKSLRPTGASVAPAIREAQDILKGLMDVKFIDKKKSRMFKKDYIGNEEWVNDVDRHDDITGIQFLTKDFFDPRKKPPKDSLVCKILDCIHSLPELHAHSKEIGVKKGSQIKIYGAFVRPSDAQMEYVPFPHREIMPFAELSGKSFSPKRVDYLWDSQVGSSTHVKPLESEALYLLGRDRHTKYKDNTDPRKDPLIKKHIPLFEKLVDIYEAYLHDNRVLQL